VVSQSLANFSGPGSAAARRPTNGGTAINAGQQPHPNMASRHLDGDLRIRMGQRAVEEPDCPRFSERNWPKTQTTTAAAKIRSGVRCGLRQTKACGRPKRDAACARTRSADIFNLGSSRPVRSHQAREGNRGFLPEQKRVSVFSRAQPRRRIGNKNVFSAPPAKAIAPCCRGFPLPRRPIIAKK